MLHRPLLVLAVMALPLFGWLMFKSTVWPGRPIPPNVAHIKWEGQLREGDIIFRRGKDAVSEAVLGLDPLTVYSHVGVVVFRGSEPMVVHAVPAEEPGEENVVKLEPATRFLAADRSSGMAVYRLHEVSNDASESAAKTVTREALRLAQSNTPFDNAFNLDTPDQLYCTELVWHIYRKARIDLAPTPPHMRFLLWSGRYIPPSTLQASPLIERVCC